MTRHAEHRSRRAALAAEHGFTMIVALGVMLVTSMLLVAAFTVAQGESEASHTDLAQKQAYYAALAGVQEYTYQLQANPSYWENCTGPKSTLPEEKNQRYEVKVLAAETSPEGKAPKGKCNSANPFATAIESTGSLANTFRIESIGYSGNEKRSLIASYKVAGFLDYVYFTDYETEDPNLYESSTGCAEQYYYQWNGKHSCHVIWFADEDNVKGPMHTNDAAHIEGPIEFGRNESERGKRPYDSIEINGGTIHEDEGEKCTAAGVIFNTLSKCYTTKGEKLEIPPGDTSLAAYVHGEDKLAGQTQLKLKGTYIEEINSSGEKLTLPWPTNGLIYVANSNIIGCSYPFKPWLADTKEEFEKTTGCGNVYVSGNYSESLTIAAENNIIINGNLTPTGISLGSAPTGTATLGLIANNYVRVYHPVTSTGTREEERCFNSNQSAEQDPSKLGGSQKNPWIYAAILSTKHSFLNDNWQCGERLEELHVYGAIAQKYRGIVGIIGSSGYVKDYKYDDRLATDEPPYFLAPLKAGWKIFRETAPAPG